MIPTIPQTGAVKVIYSAYIVLFFAYLALPLAVVAVFAFNDSQFPSLPWCPCTLDCPLLPVTPEAETGTV